MNSGSPNPIAPRLRHPRPGYAVSRRNTERGLNFVVVKQPAMRQGRIREWPRLFLICRLIGNNVEVLPCELLDTYFDENHSRSQQWKRETCEALGLLIDHTHAVLPSLSEEQRQSSDEPLERLLLRSFAIALVNGTITSHGGKLFDPTGLFWRGKGTRRAGALLARLTNLFRSFEPDGAGHRWRHVVSTENQSDNPLTALRFALELGIRRKKSLLAHIGGQKKQSQNPVPGVFRSLGEASKPIHAFPSQYIAPFLCSGFENSDGVADESAELVALIMFCGGVRVSEPFHIFVSDVQFDGKRPWMFFHHPEDGRVRDRYGNFVRRADYLQQFGMTARTLNEGREHAGWKGMAGDDVGATAYWLPVEPLLERLEMKLRRYLLVTRPTIMKMRPKGLKDHPFLFVSSGQSGSSRGGRVGDPYAITAFLESWKAAVRRTSRRCNAPELVFAKNRGTTCHGARHHYGRFLRTMGVSGELIQECMHHRQYDSHKVYTQLTSIEVNSVLQQIGFDDPIPNLRNSFNSTIRQGKFVVLPRAIT